MDGRTHRFTDNDNLKVIKEAFMLHLSAIKQKFSPSTLTTKENISEIIDALKNSFDFIIESVKYNEKSVVLNITSVYGDFGLYNFDKTIYYRNIK